MPIACPMLGIWVLFLRDEIFFRKYVQLKVSLFSWILLCRRAFPSDAYNACPLAHNDHGHLDVLEEGCRRCRSSRRPFGRGGNRQSRHGLGVPRRGFHCQNFRQRWHKRHPRQPGKTVSILLEHDVHAYVCKCVQCTFVDYASIVWIVL